jgi:hypothetical protein
MIVAFVVLFLISSQLVHSVANDQQLGFKPYYFGVMLCSILLNIVLLVSCIWYFGFLFGILIFILHIFGIVHASVSWVLSIPFLFYRSLQKIERHMYRKVAWYPFVLVSNLAFLIVSFFLTEFKSLHTLIYTNYYVTISFLIIPIVGFILRIIVVSFIKK